MCPSELVLRVLPYYNGWAWRVWGDALVGQPRYDRELSRLLPLITEPHATGEVPTGYFWDQGYACCVGRESMSQFGRLLSYRKSGEVFCSYYKAQLPHPSNSAGTTFAR